MDWTLVYIMACIMILPAFIYGGISHIMAENTFQKYAESLNQKGIPAHELTKKLLETAGILTPCAIKSVAWVCLRE